jgi:hypothetical protein
LVGGSTSLNSREDHAIDTAINIAALELLSLVELRALWAKEYGACPPLRSPDLLRMILAWRLQAKMHGGLDRATRRKLNRSGPVLAEGLNLGPGTRFTRIWQGRTEEVVVEQHGFRWNGNSYPSLSAVALAMTGTRQNGPKFFGLRGKAQ